MRVKQARDFLLAVLIAGGVIYLFVAVGSVPSTVSPSEKQSVSSVPAGSEGQLQNGNAIIAVAVDEELLPDLLRTTSVSDLNSVSDFNGRIFFVAAQTPVRVSEIGRAHV